MREDLEGRVRTHINRGLLQLYRKVCDVNDLARLIPRTEIGWKHNWKHPKS